MPTRFLSKVRILLYGDIMWNLFNMPCFIPGLVFIALLFPEKLSLCHVGLSSHCLVKEIIVLQTVMLQGNGQKWSVAHVSKSKLLGEADMF